MHKMHASLEALQLEVGCCGNPLNKEYGKQGCLATECWVKAVWERVWTYKLAVHLDYVTLAAPQENDQDLVDVFIDQHQKGGTLQGLNRCRIAHQSIHLSCILTADGKHIDPLYLSPPKTGMRTSSIQFSRERPTPKDCITWEKFWHNFCNPGLQLKVPLGVWTAPGHRIWPWLHDGEWDVVYHQSYTAICAYILLVENRTRSGSLYIFLGKVNVIPTSVVPITVAHTDHNVVAQRNNGPCLSMLKHVHETFWQSLALGGGNWMWDYISNKDTEPLWIVNALLNGTAILSTDGLYHRNKAPQASGAGWIIACRHTGRMLQGSFYKLSIDASGYQGELLGLVALHTLLHRIIAYYKLCSAPSKMICNSKLALNKPRRKGCRIRTGTVQADLFCALCTIHHGMVGTTLVYEWVKSHQDKRLPWHQL